MRNENEPERSTLDGMRLNIVQMTVYMAGLCRLDFKKGDTVRLDAEGIGRLIGIDFRLPRFRMDPDWPDYYDELAAAMDGMPERTRRDGNAEVQTVAKVEIVPEEKALYVTYDQEQKRLIAVQKAEVTRSVRTDADMVLLSDDWTDASSMQDGDSPHEVYAAKLHGGALLHRFDNAAGVPYSAIYVENTPTGNGVDEDWDARPWIERQSCERGAEPLMVWRWNENHR